MATSNFATQPRAARRSRWLAPLVAFASVLIALFALEVILRIQQPFLPEVNAALDAGRWTAKQSQFVLDDEMGYRPRTDGTTPYSAHGIIAEAPHPDAAARRKKRILFIGDSVTSRARIQGALLTQYGGSDYQLLNAGVEGFNVVQEVAFYDRYNSLADYDEVIITIHNNDLYNVPMVYRSSTGPLFFYIYGEPPLLVSSWWLERSYLYRFFVHVRMQRIMRRANASPRLARNTEEALEHLKNALSARKIVLKALVFPVLKNEGQWSPDETRSHQTALEILRHLHIDHEDLWPILRNQIAQQGSAAVAETEGDMWHPNDRAAEQIAVHLKNVDFLDRKDDR